MLIFIFVIWVWLSSTKGQQCSSSIFQQGMRTPQLLFKGGSFFEGVTPFSSRFVFFTDTSFTVISQLKGIQQFPLGRIYRYDMWQDSISLYLGDSGKAIGMARDHSSNLIVAAGADFGQRAVKWINTNSREQRYYTALFNNTQYNSPNDVIVDPFGRILFTDPRYEGQSFETIQLPQGRVYSLNVTNNQPSVLISDVEKPNGLVFSADSSRLYIAENNNSVNNIGLTATPGRRQIREYWYNVTTGIAVFNRVLVDFNVTDTNTTAAADGLEIDSCGRLFVACTQPGVGIRVYNLTNGNLLDTLVFGPTIIITNMKFGVGIFDRHILYVTGIDLADLTGVFYSIETCTFGPITPRILS